MANATPGVRSSRRTPRQSAIKGKSARSSYLGYFRASAFDRIDLIKRGMYAAEAKRIFADLDIGQGAAFKALNLSPATVNKKAKLHQTLSSSDTERVIGIAKLVGQLEAIVEESGDPNGFDATVWMSRWLKEPLPAIGGIRPVDLMDTMEGQAVVSRELARIQTTAYA
jgi:putative toxin-antitoxin system antitoxin component (TIGR02293 family)